jgi:hypothetical protein
MLHTTSFARSLFIHDRAGTLLAYVRIAVSEETSPRLHFPNGFDPHSVIFGADRVREGELYRVGV